MSDFAIEMQVLSIIGIKCFLTTLVSSGVERQSHQHNILGREEGKYIQTYSRGLRWGLEVLLGHIFSRAHIQLPAHPNP